MYRYDFLTYGTSVTPSIYLFCFLARRHVESYFPDQGSDPYSRIASGILTTGPLGKFQLHYLFKDLTYKYRHIVFY